MLKKDHKEFISKFNLQQRSENEEEIIHRKLTEQVENTVQYYLDKMQKEDIVINDLYNKIISVAEKAMLNMVITYTRGNQTKAAIILGKNRGTVQNKLSLYCNYQKRKK